MKVRVDEFRQKAGPEAIAQAELSGDEFRKSVQCCYNCRHWVKDPTLIGDYAFNTCMEHAKEENFSMFAWSWYCDKYEGPAKAENVFNAEIRRLFDDKEEEA